MVIQDLDFRRKITNTDNIVMAKKAHLVPDLLNKYPGDYIDTNYLNSLRTEQPRVIPTATIQNVYGGHSYGSESFGSDVQIPADITIQNITIGETQCTYGCTMVCTTGCPAIVDIVVIWANSGGSSGTFTPWVTIGGGDQITSEKITVAPGETGTTTFSSVSLPRGIPRLCFNIDISS
jgi:hypothetical protein